MSFLAGRESLVERSQRSNNMAAGQISVLAVDDSALIREMISSVLASKGYRVVAAGDGREALQRLRAAQQPWIVLLDIVMPLMDGLAVIREFERDTALQTMGHRFILMSSIVRMSQPDVPATYGQLAKPFIAQQLAAAVEVAARTLPTLRGESDSEVH